MENQPRALRSSHLPIAGLGEGGGFY